MHPIIQLSILPLGMINCFLIKGDKKHILVDTGLPNSEGKILRQLAAHGIRPEDIGLLVITHGHIDHFGSTFQLKQALNVPVLIHELDRAALETGQSQVSTLKPNRQCWHLLRQRLLHSRAQPCQPDIVLQGSEAFSLRKWGIQGQVLHTPGHTPGSLSVVLDDGQAIIMDLASSGILLGGIAWHSHMKHPPFHDSLPQVKASLDALLALNTHTFYLGHGNPVSRKSLLSYRDNHF
ncbi:MBL fold metallo-hydrolase [Hymenobacter glaciei]|uniref:MBL fold metallo-hydrolase n=1 Tax=Hymenobacter glaciei TaxID=877209 RepID=A0ABP7UV11_9BACT